MKEASRTRVPHQTHKGRKRKNPPLSFPRNIERRENTSRTKEKTTEVRRKEKSAEEFRGKSCVTGIRIGGEVAEARQRGDGKRFSTGAPRRGTQRMDSNN